MSAFAQTNTSHGSTAGTTIAQPGPTGNLNNPQAQANMAGQPSNAQTVPSSGDAQHIPTPVVNGQTMSSPVPQPEKPPASHIIH
jgi:hypothetical protein